MDVIANEGVELSDMEVSGDAVEEDESLTEESSEDSMEGESLAEELSEDSIEDESALAEESTEEVDDNEEAVSDENEEAVISGNSAEIVSENDVTLSDESIDEVSKNGAAAMSDEEEKSADLNADYTWERKLSYYLCAKYPELNTNTVNDEGAPQDVQFIDFNEMSNSTIRTIEIRGDDFPALTKNMVNLGHIGTFPQLETLIIDGVDEIRLLYIPSTVKRVEIRNTTLNLGTTSAFSECDYAFIGGVARNNLERFVFDNVTIGDYRKTNGTRYLDEYIINIYNSPNLNYIKVKVRFTSPEQKITINAGGTNAYSALTTRNCIIENTTEDTGRIGIVSGNPNSFFSKNYTTVNEPEFYDEHFKDYLVYYTNVDTNGDKYISQEELEAVKNLEIKYEDNKGSRIDGFHDFRDVEKLINLESLDICDFYDSGNCHYISQIAFPDNNGKFKSFTMRNCQTRFSGAINVPSVKYFEYSNNPRYKESISPQITINDTLGRLETVNLDNSSVKSLEITNLGAKRKLNLSALECGEIEYIKFLGSGYDLTNYTNLYDNGKLRYVGSLYGDDICKISGTVDGGSSTTLDISNCTKFGNDNSEIIADFDLSGGKTLYIYAYSNTFSDSHKLIINRKGTSPGKVIIYTTANDWLDSKYNGTTGFEIHTGSAIPTLAIFPHGNLILEPGDPDVSKYGRIKRWDVSYTNSSWNGVDSDIDFLKDGLKFYVEEEGSYRRIPYEGQVYYSIDNTNVARSHPDDIKTLYLKDPGRAKMTVYLDAEKTQELGYVYIYVENKASSITVSNNGIDSELGKNEDNPIVVKNNGGTASFSAKPNYDGNYVGEEKQDIIWTISEKLYNDRYNGVYVDYSKLDVSKAGFSVVYDCWNKTTSNRTFSFNCKPGKYMVIAQIAGNKGRDDACIREGRYIEVIEEAKPVPAPAPSNKNATNVTVKLSDSTSLVVNTTAGGTATITKVIDKKSKKLTIDKIVVDGVEYNVTAISAKALNGTKVTTLTLGAGVTTIKKNAFVGSKVKTLKLNSSSIAFEKGAFKKAKITNVTVPKSLIKKKKTSNAFKKAIKKAGYKGKLNGKSM